jgi:hypothetical protein
MERTKFLPCLIRTRFKGDARFCYYYLITNLITGRQYVGSRLRDNPFSDKRYMGSSDYVKADIKRYGKENFSKIILKHERFINKKIMLNHETLFILKYNSLTPNGYNRFIPNSRIGFNMSGCKHKNTFNNNFSPDVRKRISDKVKAWNRTPEGIKWREKHRQAQLKMRMIKRFFTKMCLN